MDYVKLIERILGSNVINIAQCMYNIDFVMQMALSPREERVIRERFSGKKYKEIAADFEITISGVQAINAKAIRKLRHPRNSKFIKGEIPIQDWRDHWETFSE